MYIPLHINWIYPPLSNSHHQDYCIFSRESLYIFICDCYWLGGRPNVYIPTRQKWWPIWDQLPTCKLYNSIYGIKHSNSPTSLESMDKNISGNPSDLPTPDKQTAGSQKVIAESGTVDGWNPALGWMKPYKPMGFNYQLPSTGEWKSRISKPSTVVCLFGSMWMFLLFRVYFSGAPALSVWQGPGLRLRITWNLDSFQKATGYPGYPWASKGEHPGYRWVGSKGWRKGWDGIRDAG